MFKIPNAHLRKICMQYNWFTNGTNEQYHHMFIMNDNNEDIERIASVIYICSETTHTINDIINIIKKESANN